MCRSRATSPRPHTITGAMSALVSVCGRPCRWPCRGTPTNDRSCRKSGEQVTSCSCPLTLRLAAMSFSRATASFRHFSAKTSASEILRSPTGCEVDDLRRAFGLSAILGRQVGTVRRTSTCSQPYRSPLWSIPILILARYMAFDPLGPTTHTLYTTLIQISERLGARVVAPVQYWIDFD